MVVKIHFLPFHPSSERDCSRVRAAPRCSNGGKHESSEERQHLKLRREGMEIFLAALFFVFDREVDISSLVVPLAAMQFNSNSW